MMLENSWLKKAKQATLSLPLGVVVIPAHTSLKSNTHGHATCGINKKGSAQGRQCDERTGLYLAKTGSDDITFSFFVTRTNLFPS